MSAQLNPSLQYRCMNEGDLDAVMAIENVIYTHPWTRGNFTDSLKTGSHCWVMELSGVMIGYAVLMAGAGEVHLLNLSVAAAISTAYGSGVGWVASFCNILLILLKK